MQLTSNALHWKCNVLCLSKESQYAEFSQREQEVNFPRQQQIHKSCSFCKKPNSTGCSWKMLFHYTQEVVQNLFHLSPRRWCQNKPKSPTIQIIKTSHVRRKWWHTETLLYTIIFPATNMIDCFCTFETGIFKTFSEIHLWTINSWYIILLMSFASAVSLFCFRKQRVRFCLRKQMA